MEMEKNVGKMEGKREGKWREHGGKTNACIY